MCTESTWPFSGVSGPKQATNTKNWTFPVLEAVLGSILAKFDRTATADPMRPIWGRKCPWDPKYWHFRGPKSHFQPRWSGSDPGRGAKNLGKTCDNIFMLQFKNDKKSKVPGSWCPYRGPAHWKDLAVFRPPGDRNRPKVQKTIFRVSGLFRVKHPST